MVLLSGLQIDINLAILHLACRDRCLSIRNRFRLFCPFDGCLSPLALLLTLSHSITLLSSCLCRSLSPLRRLQEVGGFRGSQGSNSSPICFLVLPGLISRWRSLDQTRLNYK